MIFGQHRRDADGMTIAAASLGAQLLSWQAAGRERLFLGPLDRATPGTAMRGGVPVIFPQFSMRGPGGRHGFARRMPWRPVEGTTPDRLAFVLEDDAYTRGEWPHPFRLRLEAALSPWTLRMALDVVNTGATSFDFAAALHTYLAVDDTAGVRISGLSGRRFLDSTRDVDAVDTEPVLALDGGEIDRIYADVASPLHLEDGPHRLDIAMSGFSDVVVWNPGPAKAAQLPDLAPGDHLRFVCVEAGRILVPVHLEPGESWRGEQSLSLSPAA
ncbi:D-hexose-6-phosphate mutarotase [Marilutibacter aestuarii]|nr:D-hexose-6-phosphate mutarotase [Lysobacter aestuarii]